jgi:hypothetical protein
MKYKRELLPNQNPNLFAVVPGNVVDGVFSGKEHDLHLLPIIGWFVTWDEKDEEHATDFPFVEPVTASFGGKQVTYDGAYALIYDKSTELWTFGSGYARLGVGMESMREFYDKELADSFDEAFKGAK